MNKIATLALAVTLCCPLTNVYADHSDETTRGRLGDMKGETKFRTMVDEAAETYSALRKGPQGEIPPSVVKNARCILVFPKIVTGALVVGVTHGNGLASCKNSSNSWSQPVPVSLNQGSIGLQAGAKSGDLVIFLQSESAVQALKQSNLTLGADMSAVAGSFDSSIDTSTAGILTYIRSKGAFAGASVNGSKIGENKDELVEFYGKNTDFTALLDARGTIDGSEYGRKLTRLFE